MGDDSPNNIEDTENKSENTKPSTYLCVMCNIGFDSIDEHLNEYHQGEEVVLEESTSEEPEVQYSSNQNNRECIVEIIETDSNTSAVSQLLHKEHYFDSNGIAYTRKFLKVPEFLHNKLSSPIIEKYLQEDGTTRKIHNDDSNVNEIFKCPKCFLKFSEIDLYSIHACNPEQITDFKCVYCLAVFGSVATLKEHMKSHHVEEQNGQTKRVVTMEPYVCEVCGTIFPSFKSLRLHRKMHEPVKEKPIEAPVSYSITGNKCEKKNVRTMFICDICNNTYDKEYEIVHMKSHSKEENFDCSVCNKKFFSLKDVVMHTKAHKNEKKFMCPNCKKPFNTQEGLKEHVGKKCAKRQYACQYCGRSFARPYEKVKHERIHTGEKPHICKICGKKFRVSYCLTLHLRAHTGVRPYECVHCGKRFKSHGVYSHHVKTHSEVRAYKCPYCPKTFKTGVQLAGHKNSHLKPFTCTICNRPFSTLYGVRSHLETHKTENSLKFTCWLCGASYGRAFALGDHMKSQHPEKNIDTDLQVDENQLEQDIGKDSPNEAE
ncbi:unnamed protein product [Acanthoscelides obtectus]|nr:unnamed protein product [Acanthoscelides obtectus]CAK1666889.1 Zinc finger protein 354B [Acanthoscelides obtectus]